MDLIDDLKQQLEELRAQLAGSNPELYRHLALYLQVLRSGLLNAVQQACFHLATERFPHRYGDLDGVQRRQLHQRLVSLVTRTSSLLTVEHLAQLAGQLAKERRRELEADRRQWLSALASAAQRGSTPEETAPSSGPIVAEGSVHLGMALPLSPDLFGSRGFPDLLPGIQPPGSRVSTDQVQHAPAEESGPALEIDGVDEAQETMAAIQAMQAAFEQAFETADSLGSGVMAESASAGPNSPPLQDDLPPSPETTPWDGAKLPTDPVNLLTWLDGFERALVRRLRNLSHAINVDLLRLGLTRSLLPVTLLEAVLTGQLETQSAPANVLALPLPLGQQPMGRSLETASVLLRLSDLEFEQPKLRTCRSRLQQQRQEVRRMAQDFRRLERRLQGLEAEQLWLQDVSTVIQKPRAST